MTNIPTLRNERFCVSVKVAGEFRKIFSIIFYTGKYSGNTYLMLEFPYFYDGKGLLSRMTHPANQKTETEISLLPQGVKTTHLAKFNHPLDGNTHFSGDGKIRTTIRNQSFRLDSSISHLFTIQIQGMEGFKMRESKRLTKKVVDLDFDFTPEIPSAIKFRARWYKATDIKGKINPNVPLSPQYSFKDLDGTVERGFVISPPESSPLADFVLLLTCNPIPLLNPDGEPHFSFIGGFDPENDISKDFHFLACLYPADNFDKLQVENIDFDPKTNNS